MGKPWEFSSKSDSVGGSQGLLRTPVANRHSAVVGGIFVLFENLRQCEVGYLYPPQFSLSFSVLLSAVSLSPLSFFPIRVPWPCLNLAEAVDSRLMWAPLTVPCLSLLRTHQASPLPVNKCCASDLVNEGPLLPVRLSPAFSLSLSILSLVFSLL